MKKIAILALFVCTVFAAAAQGNKADTTGAMHNLTASSTKMVKLFLDKNFVGYVAYLHPKLLTMMGGKDSMAGFLKRSMGLMKQQGYEITNVTISAIKTIIVAGGELQSVVPQTLMIKTAGGHLESAGYLLGMSDDNGKTWKFIDTGGNTLDKMKTMFPRLDNRLVIPAKQEPVFYKD